MAFVRKRRDRRVVDFYACIQTQLGHASPTVDFNVNTHLLKSTNQDAALRYEKMLFQNAGDKTVTKMKKGLTANAVNP